MCVDLRLVSAVALLVAVSLKPSAAVALEPQARSSPSGRTAITRVTILNTMPVAQTGKASKDTAAKDTTGKDTTSKDTASKDTASKDTADKDTADKDTADKDTADKDTADKETGKDGLQPGDVIKKVADVGNSAPDKESADGKDQPPSSAVSSPSSKAAPLFAEEVMAQVTYERRLGGASEQAFFIDVFASDPRGLLATLLFDSPARLTAELANGEAAEVARQAIADRFGGADSLIENLIGHRIQYAPASGAPESAAPARKPAAKDAEVVAAVKDADSPAGANGRPASKVPRVSGAAGKPRPEAGNVADAGERFPLAYDPQPGDVALVVGYDEDCVVLRANGGLQTIARARLADWKLLDPIDKGLQRPLATAGRRGPVLGHRLVIHVPTDPNALSKTKDAMAIVACQSPCPKARVEHFLRVTSVREAGASSAAKLSTRVTVFNPTPYDWHGTRVTVHDGADVYDLGKVSLGSLQYGAFPAVSAQQETASANGTKPVSPPNSRATFQVEDMRDAVDFSDPQNLSVKAALALTRSDPGAYFPSRLVTVVKDDEVVGQATLPALDAKEGWLAPATPSVNGNADAVVCYGPALASVTVAALKNKEGETVVKKAWKYVAMDRSLLTALSLRSRTYELENRGDRTLHVRVLPPAEADWEFNACSVTDKDDKPVVGADQNDVEVPPGAVRKVVISETQTDPKKADAYDLRDVGEKPDAVDDLLPEKSPVRLLRKAVRDQLDTLAKTSRNLEAEKKAQAAYAASPIPTNDRVLGSWVRRIDGFYQQAETARVALREARNKLDEYLFAENEAIPVPQPDPDSNAAPIQPTPPAGETILTPPPAVAHEPVEQLRVWGRTRCAMAD